MKTEQVEVKSKGDVLGTVPVPVFEKLAEAVKHYGGNETKVLELINRQTKADITNDFRAGKTRKASPVAQLMRLAKSNPEVQKKIDEFLAKYGGQEGEQAA